MGQGRLNAGELYTELTGLSGRSGPRPALIVKADLRATGYHPGASIMLTGSAHAYFGGGGNGYLGAFDALPVVVGFPRGQEYVGQATSITKLTLELTVAASLGVV